MRSVVFALALAFIAALAALTARDLAAHGITLPGALGLLVVVLMMCGIVGALLESRR